MIFKTPQKEKLLQKLGLKKLWIEVLPKETMSNEPQNISVNIVTKCM